MDAELGERRGPAPLAPGPQGVASVQARVAEEPSGDAEMN